MNSEDKVPTWEQLANEYLDASDRHLFDRFTLDDYERMATWVKTEYSLPSAEQWTSYCKRKQARQMESAISRLRKQQRKRQQVAKMIEQEEYLARHCATRCFECGDEQPAEKRGENCFRQCGDGFTCSGRYVGLVVPREQAQKERDGC